MTTCQLEGVLLIDTSYFKDDRGFFIESWHRRNFKSLGLDIEFVQDNHSGSREGVLRGMHYQDMSAPMGKLVRCTAGSIFDVVVDLRVGSPTCGQWLSCELSEQNMRQLWCPPGFAHGFLALSDTAHVQYKCSGYYAPAAEGALRWDDPDVGIEWPTNTPELSQTDARASSLEDYLKDPAFTYPVRV